VRKEKRRKKERKKEEQTTGRKYVWPALLRRAAIKNEMLRRSGLFMKSMESVLDGKRVVVGKIVDTI